MRHRIMRRQQGGFSALDLRSIWSRRVTMDKSIQRAGEAFVHESLRLAILQRVCTTYRKPLFERLSAEKDLTVRILIGDDLPNSKIRSAPDLSGLDIEKLPTRFFHLGHDVVCDHIGLADALARFRPNVILCEAESNPLSYLKAIRFRRKHPRTGLVNWGLGLLPGAPRGPFVPRYQMRRLLLRYFETCISYSSYGRDALRALGVPADRIFVAVNVCDTDFHLRANDELEQDRGEVRAALTLPDRFTCLYVGSIDPAKRLDELVRAAALLDPERFQVAIVGDGPSLPELRRLAGQIGASNVLFPGRVTGGLARWYRAADVLVLPGRGGIVISEAMAYGLPVIVYQADGTEYDLVHTRESDPDNENGLFLERGDAATIRDGVAALAGDPGRAARMGANSHRLVRERYNTDAMIREIVRACRVAVEARAAH